MKIHYKKLTQPYFDYVRLGIKRFELCKNDCDYQNGDILVLQEYVNSPKMIQKEIIASWTTGREMTTQIRCVLDDYEGLQEEYVILGIEVLEK